MNPLSLEFLDKDLESEFTDHVHKTTSRIFQITQIATIPMLIWYGVLYLQQNSLKGTLICFMVCLLICMAVFLSFKVRHFQKVVILETILYLPYPMLAFYLNIQGIFKDLNSYYIGFCSCCYYQSINQGCKFKYKLTCGILQFFINFIFEIQIHGYSQLKIAGSIFYLVSLLQSYFQERYLRNSYLLMKKDQIWSSTINQAIDVIIIQGVMDKINNTIIYKSQNEKCSKQLGITNAQEFMEFTRKFKVKSSVSTAQKSQNLETSLFYHFTSSADAPFKRFGKFKGIVYEIQLLSYQEDIKQTAILIIREKEDKLSQEFLNQRTKYRISVLNETVKQIQTTMQSSLILLGSLVKVRKNQTEFLKVLEDVFVKFTDSGVRLFNMRYFFHPVTHHLLRKFDILQVYTMIQRTLAVMVEKEGIYFQIIDIDSFNLTTSYNSLFQILYNVCLYLIHENKETANERNQRKEIFLQFSPVFNYELQIDELIVTFRQNITHRLVFLPLIYKSASQLKHLDFNKDVLLVFTQNISQKYRFQWLSTWWERQDLVKKLES